MFFQKRFQIFFCSLLGMEANTIPYGIGRLHLPLRYFPVALGFLNPLPGPSLHTA